MEICMGESVIGNASVTIDGLYATIKCACHFSDEKIYAMYLRNGTQDRLLGTCTPNGACHVLETRIPKKYIAQHSRLYAREKYGDRNHEINLLVPGQPITNIDKLDKSFLRVLNGKTCLVIVDVS